MNDDRSGIELNPRSVDEPCGQYFRYRDLIEAGETWELHRIDNRPRQAATYDAMRLICKRVLDPIHERFGGVEITYGFVSPELDKLVRQKEHPNTSRKLDQHAGCEFHGEGAPYCDRFGLAVDLRCPGCNSAEVAKWVCQNNIQFDRLYFYSGDRPFHVSVGPKNLRQLTLMRPRKSDPTLFYPQRIQPSYFDQLLAAGSYPNL